MGAHQCWPLTVFLLLWAQLGLLGVADEIEIHSSLLHHNIVRFHECLLRMCVCVCVSECVCVLLVTPQPRAVS